MSRERSLSWSTVLVAVLFAAVAVAACVAASTARKGATVVRTAAELVDVPGVDPLLAEYLRGVEGRLATVEQADPDAEMSWEDWLFALLGGGTVGTAGAAILTRRLGAARTGSRLATLAPIISILRELAKGVPEGPERQDVLARLSAAERAAGGAA